MARPLWFNKLLKAAFPQSWMVARMTRWPLVGAWLDHWLFEGDDLFVVPKPRVIVLNRTVPGQETSCVPSQVVDHFINQANYHWLMNDCICRSGKNARTIRASWAASSWARPACKSTRKSGDG